MTLVLLHLTDPPRPILRGAAEESLAAVAQRVVARWPFLPPSHLTLDTTPLTALLDAAPAPTPTPPTPKQAKGQGKAQGKALTPGQQLWRERKQRQALAERHRQHWAEKGQPDTTNPLRRPKAT
jgi:hypothetical protein